MKDIKVRFVGIESKPYDETLSILYIPDQTQILKQGIKYRIILEGLTFAETNTTKHSK